jgi:hypothetical protein
VRGAAAVAFEQLASESSQHHQPAPLASLADAAEAAAAAAAAAAPDAMMAEAAADADQPEQSLRVFDGLAWPVDAAVDELTNGRLTPVGATWKKSTNRARAVGRAGLLAAADSHPLAVVRETAAEVVEAALTAIVRGDEVEAGRRSGAMHAAIRVVEKHGGRRYIRKDDVERLLSWKRKGVETGLAEVYPNERKIKHGSVWTEAEEMPRGRPKGEVMLSESLLVREISKRAGQGLINQHRLERAVDGLLARRDPIARVRNAAQGLGAELMLLNEQERSSAAAARALDQLSEALPLLVRAQVRAGAAREKKEAPSSLDPFSHQQFLARAGGFLSALIGSLSQPPAATLPAARLGDPPRPTSNLQEEIIRLVLIL